MAIKLPDIDVAQMLKSKEGKQVIAFLVGKNSKEIGQWLIKLGKALSAENATAAVAKQVGLAGIKLGGLALGAWFAYQNVKQAIDNGQKIYNTRDQRSGLENIAKGLWETSIPYVTAQQLGKFGKWLFNKPKPKVEGVGGSVDVRAMSNNAVKNTVESAPSINPANLTVEANTGKIVKKTDVNRGPSVTEENLAKQLGMSSRPKGSGAAQTEWQKEVERRMKNSNHPSWYGKFPEFLTTNINYGVRKEGEYFDVAVGANIKCEQTLPLKKKVLSQGYIDQMNVLYAKLRGSNSGAFNYSVKDLMNYIECVRGIKILLRMMARNLRSINNIDFYVNKSPEPFMTVLGMDATGIADVRDNRARYIAKYNHLVELVNATFPLPPQMTVFDRDAYLASIILMDSKGPKASLYAYNYYVTLMAASGSGSQGKLEQNILTSNNVSYIEYNIDNAIARAHGYESADYSGVETFAKIAGDIIKAYGQSAFSYRHENIGLNDKNQTIFDEYLLHQLQNAQALSLTQGNPLLTASIFDPTAVAYTTKIKIEGDTSHTLPAAWIPCNSHAGANPVIVNTNKSNVTALETISLTRGNWFFDYTGTTLTYNTQYTVEVDTCDTVALYGMDIVFFSTNGNISSFTISSTGFTVANGVGQRALLAQLDYAPCVHTFDDRNNWAYDAVYEDLDTYGYMTVEQYRTLTDVAVISMYKTVNISDQVNFKAAKK